MSELDYLFHDDYNIELDNNELNNNELDNNELKSFFHDDQYFYAITSQVPPNETNSTLTVDHENLFYDDHYIFASASLQPYEMNDIESNESDDLSDFLELISGLTTSETDKGVLRKATYKCTKSSSYNPQVISNLTKRLPRFQKLSNEMLADIEKYVVQGQMDSGSIYPLLRHDYPDVIAIIKVEGFRTTLDLNTTYNTNRFQILLCIVAVVDNNYRTRIIANVIIEDPALIRSIIDIFLNVQHLSCIFHIDLNLRKKLKEKLGIVKYLSETLYVNKESWTIPWIHKHFTAGIQNSQRVESINKNIHDKVDRSTSLCNLLNSIKDFVKNEEHLERFEIEQNVLPVVSMPMLNTRFFSQIDILIKEYLTPVMLGKQRSQINQSVCYDVFQITEWQYLLVEIDNEEIDVEIRKQKQDIQQILFSSLVRTIPQEAILEVWNYLNPDMEPNDLLQKHPSISICGVAKSGDSMEFEKSINFEHFFSIRANSYSSQ
ncbi:hypothetical protein Glove_519g62 [Diversispora epigaea]|uniref:MULE transposase domain-containing protein n=1 Tax=Diversispora epigaea TaxID=1348612 RepID=A0A397GKJ4_9GLOM|nr:hypothetical protein Glove_519g62 [Diversispora epigaea]